jgi:hypothetical protein
MSGTNKITVRLFLLILAVLFAGSGCASEKKVAKSHAMNTGSSCSLAHLGKNRYFYGKKYQGKLTKNVRKIDRRSGGGRSSRRWRF